MSYAMFVCSNKCEFNEVFVTVAFEGLRCLFCKVGIGGDGAR